MQKTMKAYNQKQLDAMAKPTGLECVSQPLFDTQLYTSGSTVSLNFFQLQQNDPSLSNMNGTGQLPAGNYFVAKSFGFDVMQDATTAGAASEVGIVDDIQKLLFIGRGLVQLTINSKPLFMSGGIPLSFLHTSGGAIGFGYGLAAAADAVQFGNNSVPDGGYPLADIVITPLVQMSAVITWSAAQTLRAGNTRLRLWLDGTLHRPVT